ncbi:IclR family transcriptional regulator [Shinella daejeonensis]|uniref:IclR family transcriptional regulator n=1 Tax=Shinella daejeonensis TaxID=659017 RepID=UPI0020C7A070|nr:IclR family transcriptional regulator [Shinella daejeonensis]MCP8894651.1 IclR family transcriptional regulator [Shinella daejeonensis]
MMAVESDRTIGIQVIARAAAILRQLGDHPDGLSLASIAKRVGLARSTVQRIMQSLEAEGFVELSAQGHGFRLGPMLSELVYRRQADIVSEVRPLLEQLCGELGETVALCALAGRNLAAIDRCIAEQPLRVVFPLGTAPVPAHQLAAGRSIIAELPPERAKQILSEYMSETDVSHELEAIYREKDIARDTSNFFAGVCSFAVPLCTHLGLYSLAVVLPTIRVERREDAIFAGLRNCRDRIEDKIGAVASASGTHGQATSLADVPLR